MKEWGRRLQLFAALALLVAPGLAWVRFPLGGKPWGLPGWFFHGMIVAGLGVAALVLTLGRSRRPGLQLLLAVAVLALAGFDAGSAMARTEYTLDRLQLSLAQSTSVLSRVGLDLPRLAPTGWRPFDFVGIGLEVALGAGGVLGIGAWLEAAGYRSSRTLGSVLLGRPRCVTCRGGVSYTMGFCPGCGKSLADGRRCGRCGAWCAPGWGFCAGCGAPVEEGSVRS